MEEDQMVRFFRDEQTKEFLIAGTGQQHIEVIVSKLKKRYHTEVVLKAPKVPYRETIRGRADAHGRHKKQSGGHGQFGDCKIKMEPLPRGAGFEFVNDIFGGAIPKNFIPAVEKGIIETAARGFLAGYPVVDFKVTLYDGSYHDVDSNEQSFKMAGILAFRNVAPKAKPVLLEPLADVEVWTPDDVLGDVMGDLSARRGQILGTEQDGRLIKVRAIVPEAELYKYSTTLHSITHGRGTHRQQFHGYAEAPPEVTAKVAEEHAKEREHAVAS
jgi:elongation factor G